jgi:protein CpxP
MDTRDTESQGFRSGITPLGDRPRSPGRRRLWALLTVPLAVGALSISVASAHGFGGGRHGGGDGAFMQERIDHLLVAAGASDAQKTQVKQVWERLRPQLKPLRKQHADIRHQIGEAMTGATIDTAKIEQLRRQSVETMDKLSTLMTQGLVASAQVLTPEQRKIVLQKIEEHKGRRHGAAE